MAAGLMGVMVEPRRTLDLKIAFAIGLGTMIAAGIFSLSGTAVAAIGSSAVVAFVIAAVVASLTAASYSEFASIYSENGGGGVDAGREPVGLSPVAGREFSPARPGESTTAPDESYQQRFVAPPRHRRQ